MRLVIIGVICCFVFISACSSSIVCEEPNVILNNKCCMDKNENAICDQVEGNVQEKIVEQEEGSKNSEELQTQVEDLNAKIDELTSRLEEKKETTNKEECDCEKIALEDCPAYVEEVEKEITKYVCSDKSIVNDSKYCFEAEGFEYTPVTTNENGTVIEIVEISPACAKGVNGGEIHYSLGTIPKDITVQVKEKPTGNFTDLYKYPGVFEDYLLFAICEDCYSGKFRLEADRVYLMRLKFNQVVYNTTEYSNEHIIDTRANSVYMRKKC